MGSLVRRLPYPRWVAGLALLILGATVRPAPAGAQITFIQDVGTAGLATTGTTMTVTVPAAGVSVDDTLFVAVALDPTAGPVTCTDTGGNLYAVDADVQNGDTGSGVRAIVFSALIETPLDPGDTITVTHPAVAARTMTVHEFAGVSLADQVATDVGGDGAPNSGATGPTEQDDELLFGVIAAETKKTDPFTPGTGFTALVAENSSASGLSSDNVAVRAEYQIVAAPGVYAADATITAHPWAAVLVTYRARACANRIVEPGEQCDDGNLAGGDCCAGTCQFEDATVVCRPAAGVCDVPETCPGDGEICPDDEKSFDECRPAVDDCDLAESCDGISDDCPADEVESDEDGDGVCDLFDLCLSDPDPLQKDGDSDGVGDACDPCTNPEPGSIRRAKLKIAAPTFSGRSKFAFAGMLTVPLDPPLDPTVTGVRLLLQDGDALPVLAVTIPGGPGWRAHPTRRRWRYRIRAGREGIVAIDLTTTRNRPEELHFRILGRNGTYDVAAATLPLQATLILTPPFTATGQCGETLFGDPPGPACKAIGARPVVSCR